MPFSTLPLYFENAAVRLLEHPDGYAIFEYKPGKRSLVDFQAALTHTGNLLHLHNWYKILGDQRLMVPFTEEESVWVVQYWLDYTRQRAGSHYAAVILAHDVFARLSAMQLRTNIKEAGFTYCLFEEELAAATWLRQLG